MRLCRILLAICLLNPAAARGQVPVAFRDLDVNTWTKLTPLESTPVSPRLGYEGACVWDSWRQRLIRYGGHNQGGGGEQNSEIWSFDPLTAKWQHYEPNTSPPGICCGQQNVFDPTSGLYIRFPAFSGSHGWQWFREIYLNDASVWTYNLATNTWRNRRPLPTPSVHPLRCASWDIHRQVIVVFGGEGSDQGTWTYDPYTNDWIKQNPDIEPPGRSAGNMAYDASVQKHVLFGSQFDDDPFTWLYDLAANAWTKVQPAEQPPTNANDAVLTYDACNRRILCITKQSEGEDEAAQHILQTWALDTAAEKWTRLNPQREPDASGNRARQFMFVPEWNLALLENSAKPVGGQSREQQVWAYRVAEAPPAEQSARSANNRAARQPSLVEDVVVSVLAADHVELRWPALTHDDLAGYVVQRAVVEVLSEDQLTRLKSQTPPLESPSVGGIRRIGPFTMLTDKPIDAHQFTDTSVDLAQRESCEGEPIFAGRWYDEQLDSAGREYRWGVYAYRVQAVNKAGVVSGWSAATLTIPSAPQHLFAQEDKSTCHLKWQANPEQSIVGYRVYRMDGRYDKDPIPRLTPAATSATTFVDTAAGESTRRYYVVAVDAIGQEGFPSSPVWYEREWKSFYSPFVGEWHQ